MCVEEERPVESLLEDSGRRVSNDNLQVDTDQSSNCCDNSSHTEAEKSEADLSDDDKQEISENKQRACPVCKNIFCNPAEYTLHLKEHTRGTECLVCGKILSSPNSLDRHLLVHSGEKPFSWQHCGKAFTTNGNMNRHKRKRKHNGVRNNKKSKKMTGSNKEVSELSHMSPMLTGRDQKLNSGFDRTLLWTTSLEKLHIMAQMDCERHKTWSHKIAQCCKQTSLGQCSDCGCNCLRTSLSFESDKKQFLRCAFCDCGFLSREKLAYHELSHKELRDIMFSERNEEDKDAFLKSVGLMRTAKTVNADASLSGLEAEALAKFDVRNANPNLQVDSGNGAVDDVVVAPNTKVTQGIGSPCSGDRASPNAIQGPTSPAEEYEVRNQCDIDNELQCKECAVNFKTKKLLKIHKHRIHLQKSTFKCPECSYVSTDKSTLNRHSRIHTGERPYMCGNCSRTFTTETNAKRHVKKKHNILDKLKKHIICIANDKSGNTNENTKCPYCKTDFGDSKILTQHKNSPECPGKPFICSECPMRFPTKNNCLRHMTHQHKMEKDRAKQTMIISKPDIHDESEGNQQQLKVEQILDAANDAAQTGSDSSGLTEEPNGDVLNLTNTAENIAKNKKPPMIGVISETVQNLEDLFSVIDNQRPVYERPSSVEVDASYTMLKLSEVVSYQEVQEKPLDLSMRPIDMSIKKEIPTLELQQNSIKESSRFSQLQQIPLPAHVASASNFCPIRDSFFQKCSSSAAQPGLLQRNWYPCYIPNVITSTPKIFQQTRMDTNSKHLFENESLDSDDSGQNLVIAEDTASTYSKNENSATQTNSVKPYPSDDLASVSSVIDTANSQDISKFLNPATFTKASKADIFISSTAKSHALRNAADNNSKKFPCPMCDSSFDTSSTLNRHLVKHTGEKKFKCSICHKGFGTKSNCKRHELTHSARNNEKSRSSLNESQNNSDASNTMDRMEVSPIYQPEVSQCSVNGNFDAKLSSSALVPRQMTNFPTQNLVCKFCKTTYRSKQDLINHTKELHPLEYIGASFH